MKGGHHIDRILQQWPYNPSGLSVRTAKGDDGREVLQMRIEMGLLQLEVNGRPDGERPEGKETYRDYILNRKTDEGDQFVMTEGECGEVDREFVQYYHRRICWLALRNYRQAVHDADHTLELMDLCQEHSPDENWTLSHEQYRPFVMFHRIQAAALAELEDTGPEIAVQTINQGLERMREVFLQYEAEDDFDEHELVARLTELRESLRNKYEVGRTLQEQLSDAIAAEDYEIAAQLRDELNSRGSRQY